LLTAPGEEVDEVRVRVETLLHERFDIDHTTLQTMVEPLLELQDRRTR
jgi:hypothetical protein